MRLSRTSREEFRQAECVGKKRWATPQQARAAFKGRADAKKMSFFRCEFCGGVHIGHAKKRPRFDRA